MSIFNKQPPQPPRDRAQILEELHEKAAQARRKKAKLRDKAELSRIKTEQAQVRAHTSREIANELRYGLINQNMICPHCGQRGCIRTKPIVQKKGISGGKATAAFFTSGLSMLATGLSRKEATTQAYCSNCNNSWVF